MKKNNNLLFFDFFIIILVLGTFTLIKNQTDYSETEKRYLEQIPQLTISKYWKGTYQKKIEIALADQILYSEEIKNNYNKFFNLSKWLNLKKKLCKKKYINIGENRSLYGCSDYIVFNPINKTTLSKESFNSFFDSYSHLNKIIDTYYYIIDTSMIYDFTRNMYQYNLSQTYKDNLQGPYHLKTFKFKDFQEYEKYFYKTDHHWNYRGSYRGYKEIMKMLGVKDIRKPIKKITLDKLEYYGSHTQQTRYYDSYDKFTIYRFDFPNHRTYIEGEEGTYGNMDFSINAKNNPYVINNKKTKNMDMYANYYGIDYGEIIFDFENPEQDNILIISNSFDNAIDELIASHYNKTVILDVRKIKIPNFNIEEYIQENNIKKAIVISDYFFLNDNNVIRME